MRGDIVRIESCTETPWRTLGVSGELARLTKMHVSERLDYRDVPVSRLTMKEGRLG